MWLINKADSATWDREGCDPPPPSLSVHAKTVVTQRRVGGVQLDMADLRWRALSVGNPPPLSVRNDPFNRSWRNLANIQLRLRRPSTPNGKPSPRFLGTGWLGKTLATVKYRPLLTAGRALGPGALWGYEYRYLLVSSFALDDLS